MLKFTEEVFPALPKPPAPVMIRPTKIELDYWISNQGDKTVLVARCPKCFRPYVYKEIKDVEAVRKGLREYQPHYLSQFEKHCPRYDEHDQPEEHNDIEQVTVGTFLVGEDSREHTEIRGRVTEIMFDDTLNQNVYRLSDGNILYECEIIERRCF